MAAFLQLRSLERGVRRQVDVLKDDEKAPQTVSPTNGDSDSSERDQYSSIPGIEQRIAKDGSTHYLVSWSSVDDPANPHNWSTPRRLKTTFLLIAIAFVVTAASATDSAVLEPAAEDLGVSEVTEALGGTGIFLIGFGLGALLCSPLSEFVGRFPVYLGTLVIFGIWIMASALAPNIGAQIVFRFFAGFCGSAPLTVAGGTMSDLFNAKEKTWAFPMFAIVGFGGPTLGPVISGYIGFTGVLSWRWVSRCSCTQCWRMR